MTLRLGLSPNEVAALLGVSRSTIYRAMARGEIAFEVVSGKKVIPAAALVARFGEPVEVEVAA